MSEKDVQVQIVFKKHKTTAAQLTAKVMHSRLSSFHQNCLLGALQN